MWGIFLIGMALGFGITSTICGFVIKSYETKKYDGVLKIVRTDPEKDKYSFQFSTDLAELPDQLDVVLKVEVVE